MAMQVQKILIADDSSTARMVIRRCFEMIGLQESTFFVAGNGREALEILRRESIDLLVTDINMPIMDGARLLLAVKASPKLNSIPVFIVTSLGNPALEAELLRIGAEKVIYKPVTPGKFQSAMEEILGRVLR